MPSITQTIPNFFGGISKVPDSQMGRGQVKDAVNCIPDLNKGLYKRPGAKRVGTSVLANATSTGVWFHYYRDETEGSYIGQVQTNGAVNMWDAETGNAITVSYETGQQSNLQNYLSSGTIGPETLQFTTINDSTFVVNRNVTAAMEATSVSKSAERPHTYSAFVELKVVQNGRQYGLNVHDPTSNATTAITTATQIAANPTGPGFGSFPGSTGHCPHTGTKLFTLNSGTTKKNLVFRITTTGQQGRVPSSNDDDPEAADFTCSYSHRVDLFHGGEGWTVGSAGNVTMEGATYPIEIEKVETVNVRASIKAVRPVPTAFDQQTNVTPDTILGGIQGELAGLTGINVDVIGNGLYIYSDTVNFTVEAQNSDLMTVITDTVNDVTGLPFQCKHGYIVKVSNSSSADDDYYLRFEGNGGGSGPGSWVECAEPGIANAINPLTVPPVIQRQANGQFIVKRFTYSTRDVGDDNTNPVPSFIGKTINKVLFFRNRLGFLSDENVILSQPGDLGNFFVNTALTVSGTDPIDISCSSKYPAILFDALEINTGLIVFAENQQFLLATDSDILNPDTARLSSISTYNYNTAVPPFSLGTIAGFLDNAGAHTRFFVMSNVAREGEPNVNELSKVVSTALSKDIDLLADSRENTTIFFGKKNSDEVFGYKYFNVSEKQLQSSWFRWKHTRPLAYHCCVNDTYIFVDDQFFLQRINFLRDDDTTFTENNNEYILHLDNYVEMTGGTFNSTTRQTTFTLPWLANITDKSVDLVAVKPGVDGLIVLNVDVPTSGNNVTVPGNEPTLTFGYNYTMQVDLPRFFVQKVAGERTVNEERGSLVVHRVKPSFGRLGQYQSVVSRTGKADYVDDFTSSTYNQYFVADVQVEDEHTGTIPVYEKNNNFNLSIKSTSPLPATLISLTWEGDYSPKYYKNV